MFYEEKELKSPEVKREYINLKIEEDELELLRKKGGLSRSITYFKN